ncbi:uncharacterized protein KNAG_0A05830 [Huiozyma naganishii CBS 8797]|uniref:NADH:ubiquinone reductase (non-electrogenic) n=1 Tax=Huiozyma naganishii (strain ATCC MYA-139 / BCRC 22969 / CBS 8797 / KCTC 17520 / NBRC 10181 / NCYC 3082 / Yp74L-3) TaxID=1071383 RepID=J7S3X4_HUIN7|nr:hypothetical protein KNAG_0A05830 [Kazachstania naganishii CBS 8797]CCK68246.1 hypothetical protein KNAG_0A05830 [Kazachstania naganishii CBS 8797]
MWKTPSCKLSTHLGVRVCERQFSVFSFVKQRSNLPEIKPETKVTKMPSRFGKYTRTGFRYALYATLGATVFFSYSLYRELHPSKRIPQTPTFPNGQPKKTLVVLGTGWGAVSLLQSLDTTMYNVVVISPRNYFLFTPLLTSTPMGTVNLKSIVEPIRAILGRSKGDVKFYEAQAIDVDPAQKKILVRSAVGDKNNNGNESISGDLKLPDHGVKNISYDYLVVSVGAESTTFNIPGVQENAYFMKEVTDAERVRARILDNIEKASFLPVGDTRRKQLLNFLVVGGGPTGVEFAAELQDFVKQDLKKWLPELSKEVKISLVEALPSILNMFDQSLIDYTQTLLKHENIDLKLNTMVKKVTKNSIVASNEGKEVEIPYGLLVWSTGNKPRVLTQKIMSKLEEQTDRRGLLINDNLQLLGAEDSIYALGDCTFHPGFVPTAQVAYQEGRYLAKTLEALFKVEQIKWELDNNQELPTKKIVRLQKELSKHESSIVAFQYSHMGTLAYIGSEKAIADLNIAGSQYKLSGGPLLYWFWKSVYLTMCISLRNRVMVTADWINAYIFGRDSSV